MRRTRFLGRLPRPARRLLLLFLCNAERPVVLGSPGMLNAAAGRTGNTTKCQQLLTQLCLNQNWRFGLNDLGVLSDVEAVVVARMC